MGDPLSVAASITGLIALASQLYLALDSFIHNVQDAPALAQTIQSEIKSFRNSLNALHSLLEDPGFCHSKRATLISADYVVVSFTDAVLVFSQLETNVLPLTKFTQYDFIARTQWTRKKTTLNELVGRLQWQKHTLVLQLNILRCASDIEAERNRQALDTLIRERLGTDRDMERRLELLEQQLQLQSNASLRNRFSSISTDTTDSDNGTVRATSFGAPEISPASNKSYQHAFEPLLNDSWVYRRNQDREEDMSVRSSALRLSAWSVLSDISLAHISIITVMYLPVQYQELSNGSWYGAGNLTVNNEDQSPQNDVTPSTQPFADTDDQDVYEYDNGNDTDATRFENESRYIPGTVAPRQTAKEHEWTNKPVENEHGYRQLGRDAPQVEIFKTFRVSIDDPCRTVLPVALKRYNITDDWRQYALYIVHGDQERCLGLEEKPLLLFRQLDTEGRKPMFMLRRHAAPQEGWITRSGHPYDDTREDQGTPMFRCWSCKEEFEMNVPYARSAQGVFCMPCHEMLMARRRKRPKPEDQEPLSNIPELE